MKSTFLDLLKVGLTENHVRSALILFGVFFGYASQYSELLGCDEDAIYETVFQFVLIILPIFIVLFLLLSVFISLWKIFMRYFDLTVAIKQSGLSVKAGLFKKEENFVPINKIQYIKWQSNPLRRLIGFQSLAIYQAASAEVSKKKTVRVPGCKKVQRKTVSDAFFPEYKSADDFADFRPNSFWLVRLMLFFVGLPLLIAGVVFYFEEYLVVATLVAFSIAAIFFVAKYVQHYKVRLSDKLLVFQSGFVFPEQILLKLYKVQNVAVKQSIFQKRRGLVSLKVYTAAGNLSVPYVDEKEGFSIANKLLFEIEKSTKSWM
jgi:putative membrane protein